MVLRCHLAHWDILPAAEDSSSGQMKICSCSFSKWPPITYHMLDAVPQCRAHGNNSDTVPGPQEFTLQQRKWCVCVCEKLCNNKVEQEMQRK